MTRNDRPLWVDIAGRLASRAVGAAGLVAIGVVIAQNGLGRTGGADRGAAPSTDAAVVPTAFVPTAAPVAVELPCAAGAAAPADVPAVFVGNPPEPALPAPLPGAPPAYDAPPVALSGPEPIPGPMPPPLEEAPQDLGVGEKTNLLPPPPGPVPAPAAQPVPEAAPLSLQFVPDDAALVIAARPAALMKRAELKSLYELMVRSQPELRHYADLANLPGIEQATLVVARHGLSAAALQEGTALFTAVGLVVRTSQPRDWKATLAAVAPGIPHDESRYAGKTYTRFLLGEGGMSFGMYMPDERTMVVAGLPNLFGFMAAQDRPARPAWAEAWEAVGGAELAVAVDIGTVRGQLEPTLMEAPQLVAAAGIVAPLWEDTTGLVLGVSLADELAFDLVTTSPSEETGANVARTLDAVLTLSRNSSRASRGVLDRLGAGAEGGEAAVLLTVADLASRLLDATRVERHGTLVRLRTSADPEMLRAARPWVKAAAKAAE